MPIKCPKGTSIQYRHKKTKTGKMLRLGGCMRKGRFIKNGVKEVIVKYNPKQLAIGTKIEMEHTKSKTVAKRIAKDHLRKHPNYYTEFVKWEKSLLKKK